MTLQNFSDKLLRSLEVKIRKVDLLRDNLTDIGKLLTEIRIAIRELKEFMAAYRFADMNEEINFFKTVKPRFISIHVFHRKAFAIRLFDSFRDEQARYQNYDKILTKLKRYADQHRLLYEYWITDSHDLDAHYFVRKSDSDRLIDHDEKFSTGYDVLIGKLMAHDQLKNFIFSLKSKGGDGFQSSVAWTASKFSLIELVYALHAAKAFNNGTSDIKEIVAVVEKCFKVSLGNFYRYFQDIRARKVNHTIFLDQLREALQQHIEAANE